MEIGGVGTLLHRLYWLYTPEYQAARRSCKNITQWIDGKSANIFISQAGIGLCPIAAIID